MEGVEPKSALRILVFNYKGGCGKTTTTANLAAALAWKGQKVLMIDADSQCNLTSFYLEAKELRSFGTEAVFGPGEDLLLNMRGGGNGAAGANGGGNGRDEQVIHDELSSHVHFSPMSTYIEQVQNTPLYTMFRTFFEENDAKGVKDIVEDPKNFYPCNQDSFGSKLWLLTGSPLLSQFEGSLAIATQQANASGHRALGLLNHIMTLCERKYGFDVILVDVNPGNSVFNQYAAASCDFIIAPTQASLYSAVSVHGVLTSIMSGENGWLSKHEKLANVQWDPAYIERHPHMENWRLPREPTRMLPFLVNNYPREQEVSLGEGSVVVAKDNSQFVYTMEYFIENDFKNDGILPKVEIVANKGRKVISFLPQLKAVGGLEGIGRSFVEAIWQDLDVYYYDKDGKSTRSTAELDEFHDELELGKERFFSLADWIMTLVQEKRSRL